jgi:hypothetical protein
MSEWFWCVPASSLLWGREIQEFVSWDCFQNQGGFGMRIIFTAAAALAAVLSFAPQSAARNFS